MKLSTKGINGDIAKSIRVMTNDPGHTKFKLKIMGEVYKFAIITPSKAILKGIVGEKINQVVTVVSNPIEPFRILSSNSLNKGDFQYSMTEIESDGKKEYQFFIENTKTSPGKYSDKIFIFTDSMEHNPVIITVSGDISPILSENSESDDVQSANGSMK